MKNDTISKTLLVTILLCLTCSVVVSTAAIGLRPQQDFNRELDMRTNILEAAGLYRPDRPIEELFKDIEVRVISLDDGQFVDTDPALFDMRRAARDPEQSTVLPPADDIARIKHRPHRASIYLVRQGGRITKVILPVSGYGLWSTLHGFLSLERDGKTVYGLQFYEHHETPGLGGEVDNPGWQRLWRGKRLYDDRGQLRLEVVKGKTTTDGPDARYQVDGLSGATLTSRGVSNMIRFWGGDLGYRPFLERVRNGEVS